MKKLIALSLLALAVSAQAQHHHHHRHGGGNWIAPVIVGGVIGYALTRNYTEPVYNYGYVPPPPVVVQQSLAFCLHTLDRNQIRRWHSN